MQQQFYDTDILTDHPPSDMHSEKDLPKDKLFKKKLLFKEDLYRVHKQIRKAGLGYQKPASYDEVVYKYVHITQEQYDNSQLDVAEVIKDIPSKQCNIGFPGKEEKWLDRALQAMKQEEITIIIIEHLQFDGNEMKILDKNEYILIQSLNWVTIVDLYQDMGYMKRVLQVGRGNQRCELHDEIDFSFKIWYHGQVVKQYQSQENELPVLDNGTITKNVWKIMKTMKPDEKCICTVRDQDFRKNEDPEYLSQILSNTNIPEGSSDWKMEVEIKEMFKVDDIYGDGVLTKKIIRKGNSTAKPDKVSEVCFDLWIYVPNLEGNLRLPHDDQLIFASSQERPRFAKTSLSLKDEPDAPPTLKQQQEPSMRYFIDDRNISKLLRQSLLRVKKRELSIFTCRQAPQFLIRGFDATIIQQKLGSIPPIVIYVLKTYEFTEGKNNFTLTLDEKITQTIRKKQYGLDYIKCHDYGKALKVFKSINAYFDYGTFTEEDKQKMLEYQVSSLMNTSLCQLKLQLWKDIVISTSKVLGLQPKHPKATFRKATALKHLGEYVEAQKLITEALESEQSQEFEHDLIVLKQEIERKEKAYQAHQKQMFQKMFDQ